MLETPRAVSCSLTGRRTAQSSALSGPTHATSSIICSLATMLHLLIVASSTGACPSTCTTALVYEAAKIDMMKYVDLDYTCDANIDFMSGMIGHHAGAIAMCYALYTLTAPGKVPIDPEIGTLCDAVVSAQSSEVTTMEKYLTDKGFSAVPPKCDPGSNCIGTCPTSILFDKASKEMKAGMTLDYTCEPSVDFVNQMIAHHQGAIASCKVLTDSAADGTITLDFTVEICARASSRRRRTRSIILCSRTWRRRVILRRPSYVRRGRCSGTRRPTSRRSTRWVPSSGMMPWAAVSRSSRL